MTNNFISSTISFNALNSLKASLNNDLNNNKILLKTNEAIKNAGFEMQIQEYGSFRLIEQEVPTERTTK